jgi:hypothetical protein
MAKIKEPIEHKDKLGRQLKIGDAVCYPNRNTLEFGTIKKFNPKMVTVWELDYNNYSWYKGNRKYPGDLVKVDGPEVTMYLLKASARA